MADKRKYEFSWDLIGDIDLGRPNLGNTTRVEIYRLLQFTFRDIIEKKVGTEEADTIFYEAGKLAGAEFYKNMMEPSKDISTFLGQLQEVLSEFKIGILRVEKVDLEEGELVLTVAEDLDCSGLPEVEHEVCTYDEGFICALLESFTGTRFQVKEVDCWCTGDRTCRFNAISLEPNDEEE
jgi:uncharacterized protein